MKPIEIHTTLLEDHVLYGPNGDKLEFFQGQTISGWAWLWRTQGQPSLSHKSEAKNCPDYFRFEFRFLWNHQSWVYVGEITQETLRLRQEEQLHKTHKGSFYTMATHLSDELEFLQPRLSEIVSEDTKPDQIQRFRYSMKLEETCFWVALEVRYSSAFIERSYEEILFLPASQYHFSPTGEFISRNVHSESFSLLYPTPMQGIDKVLSTDDTKLISEAFQEHPECTNKYIKGYTSHSTLIDWAIKTGDSEMVRFAVDLGADPNHCFDFLDSWGTALHRVVVYEKPQLIEPLIQLGANPNIPNLEGKTPLHTAAKDGKLEIQKLLLEFGASDEIQDAQGLTPRQRIILRAFHDDVRNGDIAKVKEALERWKQQNQSNNEFSLVDTIQKQNALCEAAEHGQVEILKILLPLSKNINLPGREGALNWTPLSTAVVHKKTKAVEVLLKHGADPSVATSPSTVGGQYDPGGQQALHLAAEANSARITKLLLQHGADVNARDAKGQTPLIILADWHGFGLKITQLLIQHGADVDAKDNKGQTALDYAGDPDQPEFTEIIRNAKIE